MNAIQLTAGKNRRYLHMDPLNIQEQLLSIRAIAQHEAAHYVAALALGFEGADIDLHVQLEPYAHHGKARADYSVRCESITELHELMTSRVIIVPSGAMGEAIDRSTFRVNASSAYKILNEGSTGAGQDLAIAKELVNLIHNSSPMKADLEIGRDQSSGDRLTSLLGNALALVESNAKPICVIADALVKKVVEGKGIGDAEKCRRRKIISGYCLMNYPSLPLLVSQRVSQAV